MTRLVRWTLWITAPFNLLAAYAFAFPMGSVGNLLRLPQPAYGEFYMLMTASLVGLFGLAYIWMALQPAIDKPLLFVGAAGKAMAATTGLLLMLSGQLSTVTGTLLLGDYLFAGFWIYWLWSTRS